MRVVVLVTSGADEGRKLWLVAGQHATVGSGQFVDFEILGDAELAPAHFVLECSQDECKLKSLDLNHAIVVNGRRRTTCSLADGDKIVAGTTQFRVTIESSLPRPSGGDEPELTPAMIKERVLGYLSALPDPLFALLDAARDPMVLALLVQTNCEYESLYEGIQGQQLMAVAPYLVRLPSGAPLLTSLVNLGWGQSWGVFLTSAQPFKEVRKNFRRFLMIETDEGESVYFRFYDPRVLRLFLPTCMEDEAQRFFGPVDTFFVESVGGSAVLEFEADGKGSPKELAAAQLPPPAALTAP